MSETRSFTARRLLTVLGALLVVLGIGLSVMHFGVTLDSAPRSDFIGLSGGDPMPDLPLLNRDLKATKHLPGVKAPRVSCGMPLRMVFRSDPSLNGAWLNYSPNSGVTFAPGPPPTTFCKPAAQRRVEIGVLLVLLGLVAIVASRRFNRAPST